jgi:3-methyladenine DNA glycosylase AlkD
MVDKSKLDKIAKIKKELRRNASKEKAIILARFFKTGRGEYGEGDKFLGVIVPVQRQIAKKYSDLNLISVQSLLASKFHEERLVALFILVEQYKKAKSAGDKITQKNIFSFYLKNILQVNNWDLVDLSAPNIVGDFLLTHNRSILQKLARNKNIWSRRVAVLATFPFIKTGQFAEILALTNLLIWKQREKHDLIHKALGWMWREVGKSDPVTLEKFLDKNASQLPRVTLRYAIEKMPDKKRKGYLHTSSSSAII